MFSKTKHLYQRAGFGATPEEWNKLQSLPFKVALDQLFAQAKTAPPLTVVPFEELAEDMMSDRRKAGRLLMQQYVLEWPYWND